MKQTRKTYKKKYMLQLANQYMIDQKEIFKIKQRFDSFSKNGIMNLHDFKQSMGILGMNEAQFLSERIFCLIDQNKKGGFNFQSFLKYLSIIMKGSNQQKAQMSFKFLDIQGKGFLCYDDIKKIFFQISYMWNYLTDSKVIPSQQHIKKVCNQLNLYNQKDIITLNHYKNIYEEYDQLFDWYNFFNQNQKDKDCTPTHLVSIPITHIRKTYQKVYRQYFNLLSIIKQASQDNTTSLSTSDQYIFGPIHTQQKFYPLKGDQDIQQDILIEQHEQPKSNRQQKLTPICQIYQKLKQINDINHNILVNKFIDQKKDKNQNISQMTINRKFTIKNIHKPTNSDQRSSIYFGHQNWNLILNMIIGIRLAVKNLYLKQQIDQMQFTRKYVYNLISHRTTYFDNTKACQFVEYGAKVFEQIRLLGNISNQLYLRSIGPQNLIGNLIMGKLSSLTQQVSYGKSGSFFYYTPDSKIMIKTISEQEFLFFRSILKKYYQHLKQKPQSLICRILGLYKMKIFKDEGEYQKLYIISMSNLFSLPLQINKRYDIKGSTFGRSSRNSQWNKNIALKDLDFIQDQEIIDIQQEQRLRQSFIIRLMKILRIDSYFFMKNDIIDYSLMIGIHIVRNYDEIMRYLHQANCRTIFSRDKKKLYLIGIIDILTQYNSKKKLQGGFKKIFLKNASCVPPSQYGNRFYQFIQQNILK